MLQRFTRAFKRIILAGVLLLHKYLSSDFCKLYISDERMMSASHHWDLPPHVKDQRLEQYYYAAPTMERSLLLMVWNRV